MQTPIAHRVVSDEEYAKRRKAAFGCQEGQFPVPDDSVFFGPTSDEEFAEMFGDEFLALHQPAGSSDDLAAQKSEEP